MTKQNPDNFYELSGFFLLDWNTIEVVSMKNRPDSSVIAKSKGKYILRRLAIVANSRTFLNDERQTFFSLIIFLYKKNIYVFSFLGENCLPFIATDGPAIR